MTGRRQASPCRRAHTHTHASGPHSHVMSLAICARCLEDGEASGEDNEPAAKKEDDEDDDGDDGEGQ
eukprot:5550715-Amphidinium_carterae.1